MGKARLGGNGGGGGGTDDHEDDEDVDEGLDGIALLPAHVAHAGLEHGDDVEDGGHGQGHERDEVHEADHLHLQRRLAANTHAATGEAASVMAACTSLSKVGWVDDLPGLSLSDEAGDAADHGVVARAHDEADALALHHHGRVERQVLRVQRLLPCTDSQRPAPILSDSCQPGTLKLLLHCIASS